MAYELHEKCAVAGAIIDHPGANASPLVYESLFAMQHRGTEASGIVSESAGGSLQHRRGLGMVVDVYSEQDMAGLSGQVGIGHNRYSTSGAKVCHAQKVVDEPIGLAISVKANFPSTRLLKTFLQKHEVSAVPLKRF